VLRGGGRIYRERPGRAGGASYAAGGYERYARLPERFTRMCGSGARAAGVFCWPIPRAVCWPAWRIFPYARRMRPARRRNLPSHPACCICRTGARAAGAGGVAAGRGRALLIGGGDLADELAAAGPVVRALRPGEAPERVYVLGQSLAAGSGWRRCSRWRRSTRPGAGSVRRRPAHAGWSGAGGLHRVARAGVPALARAQPALRPSRGVAQHLAAEPASANGEWTLIRGGERRTRAWARLNLPEARQSAFREGGVYVIAGGAGGLGYVFSEHLVRRYGARVAWLGRRPLDAQIEARQAALARDGVGPLYLQADIADEAQLRAAAAEIKARWGAIHGVIHSALVLDDRSVGRMSAETLEAVLRPKAAGSRRWSRSSPRSRSTGCASSLRRSRSAAEPGRATTRPPAPGRTPMPRRWPHRGVSGACHQLGLLGRGRRGLRRGIPGADGADGVGSIGAAEGIEIVERVLAGGPRQVAAIKLSAPLAREMGLADAAEARIEPPSGVCLRLDTKAVPPLGMPQLYEQVNALARAGARQELLAGMRAASRPRIGACGPS